MKTRMFNLLFLLGILGFANSCSSSEDGIMENAPLEELIMDDGFVGEKWDGEGILSWLHDRLFDFILYEKDWFTSSYDMPMLYKLYRFTYQDNLMVALEYYCYRGKEAETGVVCYTNDGKRVSFNNVKHAFDQTSALVWTNQWDDEQIPQLADFKLDGRNVDWLQSVIDQACMDIQEPAQFLYTIYSGIDEENQCVLFAYEYANLATTDDDNLPKGVYYCFNMDGELVDSQTYTVFEDQLADINDQLSQVCILSNTFHRMPF